MTIVNSLSECVIPEDKVWPLYPDSICTKDKFKPLIQICSPRRYSMKLLVGRLFSMQVEPSVYTCSDVFLKIPQRVATDYTQAIALLVSSSCLQSPLVWTRTFLLDPLKSVSATHSLSLLTSFFCPASLMALKISARTFVCPIPTAAVPASLLTHSFPLTPADTGTNMKLILFSALNDSLTSTLAFEPRTCQSIWACSLSRWGFKLRENVWDSVQAMVLVTAMLYCMTGKQNSRGYSIVYKLKSSDIILHRV